MKLRILGNSLRFRLAKSEVASFGQSGSIEGGVRFGKSSENDLRFKLQMIDGLEFTGKFSNGNIVVGVPQSLVDQWVSNEEVSISGSQKLDKQADLKFLIEKDFVCLNSHNDEDQSDRYPHPKGTEAC